ncbi:hypothetical protein C8Q80DRAFT_1184166 [Daedaleopsis nitida]|nr:hypothetical protein C8Q80DRAFT_1184166 [Daedaleopsis nitida]
MFANRAGVKDGPEWKGVIGRGHGRILERGQRGRTAADGSRREGRSLGWMGKGTDGRHVDGSTSVNRRDWR